ncbi:MAG: acetylglutamate kinase, partial [Oscillospiraceae bacterium]|nr:acetylglutamate kinase [Oscillospiraceae bacterium]
LKKQGIESRFKDGLRVTDKATMDVVQSVLCGKVNKDLVAAIERKGASSVGLCGIDANLFRARQLDPELGYVGEITSVDPGIVQRAVEAGRIPVVATVAYGEDAPCAYNVNADTAAAELAIALGAEKLILLTNTRGLLREFGNDDTLISRVALSEIEGYQNDGILSGGMIPKVDCCRTAVEGGVRAAHILDGRVPHSILVELFTNEGFGTIITAD